MSNELQIITPNDLLMTESPFNAEQLKVFYEKTPKDKLMQRPAKGGGTWDYVQTGYVIETLNRLFGYFWSFEVLTGLEEAAKIAGSGTCVVKGRLTVYAGDKTLVKEQFGRCEVKFKTSYEGGKKVKTNDFLDFGNDLKGAASDALKKCASELGLFRDVYHGNDFEERTIVDEAEKAEIISQKEEEAKEELAKAKTVQELYATFMKFPSEIRKSKSVVASARARRSILEGKRKAKKGVYARRDKGRNR